MNWKCLKNSSELLTKKCVEIVQKMSTHETFHTWEIATIHGIEMGQSGTYIGCYAKVNSTEIMQKMLTH